MTKAQKREYKEGGSLFCYKLSATGFTFPDINGEYTLEAFSPDLGYYKISKQYALIFYGTSIHNFTEAKIVSVDNPDNIVAGYNSQHGIWLDYFGDCKPEFKSIQVNITDI